MTRDEQWLLDEKYGGKETQEYESDKKRLSEGEPLGYVIGWQPFFGLKIYLDSKPLIPRPETEWWTEKMIGSMPEYIKYKNAQTCPLEELAEHDGASPELILQNHAAPCPLKYGSAEKYAVLKAGMSEHSKFLDLCAGSGAIGCAALARLPQTQVYFGEIDSAHESTIRKNINENNLDCSRADIRIGNLFELFGDMKFDIIAANPPYIPAGRALPASVADHEPALALYAGADGLDFIRRIAKELPQHLTENGVAWIECDSAHTAIACALCENQNLRAEILNDQYGRPRVIRTQK